MGRSCFPTLRVDTDADQLSTEEQIIVDALMKASDFPLSVVLVGDGPWDTVKKFIDPFHHLQTSDWNKVDLPPPAGTINTAYPLLPQSSDSAMS